MRAIIIDDNLDDFDDLKGDKSGLNMKATRENGINADALADSLYRATDPLTADGSYPYAKELWKTDDKMLSRDDDLDDKKYQDKYGKQD
jgi:hypothetical protein